MAIGNSVTVMGPSFRVAILAPVYWKAHIRLTRTSNRKYQVERLSPRALLSFINIPFPGACVSGFAIRQDNI